MGSSGPRGLSGHDPNSTGLIEKIRTEFIDGMLAQTYQNVFDETYNDVVNTSLEVNRELKELSIQMKENSIQSIFRKTII